MGILTEIPVTAIVRTRYLSFHLADDLREFVGSTPRGFLGAGCISGPFHSGTCHPSGSAEKGGGALRHGEQLAVREVVEYVEVFEFVPGRRIELG